MMHGHTYIKYVTIVWYTASEGGKMVTLHEQLVLIVVSAEHTVCVEG